MHLWSNFEYPQIYWARTEDGHLFLVGTVAHSIVLYKAARKTCSGCAGETPTPMGGPALVISVFLESTGHVDSKSKVVANLVQPRKTFFVSPDQ